MNEVLSNDTASARAAKAAGVITLASVIGYGISFSKAAIVAAYMGTGWQMDVFLWSFALVSLFASVVSSPLTAVLVPVYLSLKAKNAEGAKAFFNSVLGLLFVSFAGVSFLLSLGGPLIARFLGGDLSTAGINLTLRLIWLMLPVVLFNGVWTACQAILNAERSFFLPALSASLPAVLVILSLVIGGSARAVYAQAISLSVGALCQWLLLMAVLWRRGLGRRWTLNLRSEGMARFLKLLWPLAATQVLILCLPIVDRTMAARYSTGTISALGYAQTLMSMSATVFLTALNTALLPLFSQQVAEEGLASFRKTFVPTIRVLVTFLIPLCVLLIVLQKPVIQVVFERGAFDIQATTLTAPAFAAYMLGVLPMAITFLCSRGFNAQQDSKTNALIGVLLYVVVKIVMNVLLSRVWGYLGLALATSIAYAATAVAMLWVMWRRLGGLEGRRLFQTGGKTLVASFFAGVLAWWGAILGGNNPLLQLGLGGGLALIGFGLFSYTLKLEDAQRLFNVIIQTAWNQGRVILHGESRQ